MNVILDKDIACEILEDIGIKKDKVLELPDIPNIDDININRLSK